MQQGMYTGALYFCGEAKSNHAVKGDPFVMWRNLFAAVFFSFAAIEACINQIIGEHVDRNKERMSPEEIDRWTEKKRHLSIERKLNEGIELYGGKGTRLSKDTALWNDFIDLKRLRNELVHYKVAYRLYSDTQELMERMEKGIRTTSTIIKRICKAHPDNQGRYPPVFDSVP
jgi:hypothetical protein